jgi:hypothetical protein
LGGGGKKNGEFKASQGYEARLPKYPKEKRIGFTCNAMF